MCTKIEQDWKSFFIFPQILNKHCTCIDCCCVFQLFGPKYRGLSMAAVFMISAVCHEYVLVMALGFFYPVLFVMFMGAGCKYSN